jgi:PAS domain S-box-containing protein
MTSKRRRPSHPMHTGNAHVPVQIVAANADETARATTGLPAAEDVSQQHREAMVTLDSIDSCVLRADLSGNVTYMNRWAEMLTGWPQDEAMGRPVADVLPLFDGNSGEALNVATVLLRVRSAIARIGSLECKLVRRDGVEFGIENRITMVDDQAGNAVGAVITFRDVTVDAIELRHRQFQPLPPQYSQTVRTVAPRRISPTWLLSARAENGHSRRFGVRFSCGYRPIGK